MKVKNDTPDIEDFRVAMKLLDMFFKGMRVNGYFGESPQSEENLNFQNKYINDLRSVEDFVEENYKKNRNLIEST